MCVAKPAIFKCTPIEIVRFIFDTRRSVVKGASGRGRVLFRVWFYVECLPFVDSFRGF